VPDAPIAPTTSTGPALPDQPAPSVAFIGSSHRILGDLKRVGAAHRDAEVLERESDRPAVEILCQSDVGGDVAESIETDFVDAVVGGYAGADALRVCE